MNPFHRPRREAPSRRARLWPRGLSKKNCEHWGDDSIRDVAPTNRAQKMVRWARSDEMKTVSQPLLFRELGFTATESYRRKPIDLTLARNRERYTHLQPRTTRCITIAVALREYLRLKVHRSLRPRQSMPRAYRRHGARAAVDGSAWSPPLRAHTASLQAFQFFQHVCRFDRRETIARRILLGSRSQLPGVGLISWYGAAPRDR